MFDAYNCHQKVSNTFFTSLTENCKRIVSLFHASRRAQSFPFNNFVFVVLPTVKSQNQCEKWRKILRTNRGNLAGELVDDGAERRARAAGGGRRGHGLLAQGQSSVRLLWPLHDLVSLAVGEKLLILVSSWLLLGLSISISGAKDRPED